MIGRITLPQHLRNSLSVDVVDNRIIPVLRGRGVGGAITIQLPLQNKTMCLIHIYGTCFKIDVHRGSYYEDCLDSEGVGGMPPTRGGLVGVE